MKIMHIRILILIPLFSFSQKVELKTDSVKFVPEKITIYTARDCSKGEKEAIKDFNDGVYNYFTYGLTIEKNKNEKSIEKRIKEFLKLKYSINYEHKGCLLFEDAECYMKKMIELTNQKFGKNYFERKFNEAYKKIISN